MGPAENLSARLSLHHLSLRSALWRLAASAGVLLLGSLSEIRADQPSADKRWVLKTITVGGQAIALPSPQTASISFSPDGKVSGNSGVNLFSGGYRITGKQIEWTTPFRSTRKAGPKELMELESTFMKVLPGCNVIEEATTLTLSGAEGTLTFAQP